ncbi:MAG: peptidyl-prolyl cis-trans isomerase [Pseudomonadota bacterium]
MTASLNPRVSFLLLAFAGCNASPRPAADVATAGSPSPAADPSAVTARAAAATPPTEPSHLAPPARARWRLASSTELESSLLCISQILVRHAQVQQGEVSFKSFSWHAMPPAPERTAAEALHIASRLAEQARAQPDTFAALAQRHSEDIVTRERGGALGCVPANHLSSWPPVLDALAATPVGQVSAVVETEYGFHVFRRSPPPAREVVSGERIVIGHDQAEFLRLLRGDDTSPRSRDQGLALARQVYGEAIAQPDRFGELAARYSEHPDVPTAIDFGAWSTWEPSDYPAQVAMLRELAVGEVSKPFETVFGWEILRRTANRARAEYAMTAVEIPFGVGNALPAEATTGESARALAEEFAQILRAQPERFDELQKRGCCTSVVQWPEGRGPGNLMAVLRTLAPGQIAPDALRLGLSYVVPKRVTAGPAPEVTARFELPSPSEPDLPYLLTSSDDEFLAEQLKEISAGTATALDLSDEASTRLRELQTSAQAAGPPGSAKRELAFEQLQANVRRLLGGDGYDRYLAIAKQRFTAASLAQLSP